MELVDIRTTSDKHWQKMWEIYESSFPDYERRKLESHLRACEDPSFHPVIVVDGDQVLALIFYWDGDGFIYGEHLAVNPEMRGRNIGSELMSKFFEQARLRTVIFEIDPPVDDISIRRLNFYKRLGVQENNYDSYRHPSYRVGGHAHKLEIMSFPDPIDVEKFERFRRYMAEVVTQPNYIDK